MHDLFLTDTADYADIVLPATTQLEHFDVHKSYGHLYVLANNPAIAPLGESRRNIEVFRLLAKRMGFTESCFDDADEDVARQALRSTNPRMQGIEWASLKESGWRRLAVPERFAPFAEGGFPTPSGKCEFYSETAAKQGLDPLPGLHAAARERAREPRSGRSATRSRSSRRRAGTSSTRRSPTCRSRSHPRRRRGSTSTRTTRAPAASRRATRCASSTIAARSRVKAAITTRARPGCVVAPSVWWRKLAPDGRNANDVTSQALADLGGAATFYDCLVEVAKA